MFKENDLVQISEESPFHAGKQAIFKNFSKLNPEHATLCDVTCKALYFAVSKIYLTKVEKK